MSPNSPTSEKSSIIHQHEKGQAIVLLLLGFVVLLGFTALAIDGSMVYSDRRFAQNAADAASLAGGGAAAEVLEASDINDTNWDCSASAVENAMDAAIDAAIDRAADNDFSISEIADPDAANHGVATVCDIVDHGGWEDNFIDIQTNITSQTDTSFAHFVFSGQMKNSVQAVSRIRPRIPAAYGHAVVALNDAACSGNQNGVVFGGNNDTSITGGGVWSSGCLICNGTSFGADIDEGGVDYVGETDCNTSHNISPSPEQVPEDIPDYSVDIPSPAAACAGLPNRGSSTSGGTIQPGRYDQIRLQNGSLTMNPGLYCVTGSPNAFTINGGELTALGVTIYVPNGGISISGNADPVNLTAPNETPDPAPAIPGVIFYATGQGIDVDIQGNAGSTYLGLIFAPNGNIHLSGDGAVGPTFNTQLIGYNVEISGNADLEINFNGPQTWNRPTMLELSR